MKKVKVDIISGFLGAGKTTFIKKLMRDVYSDEKVVILENEFGNTRMDQETLGREGITVELVLAGCICCSSTGGLIKGINEIIRVYEPERIIVEPTGIAKLSDVIKILQTQDMIELAIIDHVVTIVDAKNYYIRMQISKEFFENQIRSSEIIFLSKTDQMEEKSIKEVINILYKIHPNNRIISEVWDRIYVDQLNEILSFKIDSSEVKLPIRLSKNQRNDFESYEIETAERISVDQWKLFLKDVTQGSYGEIYRVKGHFRTSETDWFTLQYVPGETIILPLIQINETLNQTKISIIGRLLEVEKLKERFRMPSTVS